MHKNTIEILLLFGIVFVSLAIIVFVGRQYASHLELEGFQGVARGGATPINRDVYDRPTRDKERYTRETYSQNRYDQKVENITNAQIRHIKIEGGSDYLQLSYIAVYNSAGAELSTKSTVTSSGENQWCRDDWKFGSRWNVTGWAWRDGYVPKWGCDTAGMWYVKDGDIRTKDYAGLYHSSGAPGWLQMTLDSAYWLDRVVIYNRKDCCGSRLSGYKIKFYNNDSTYLFEYTLNGNQEQTITLPTYTCRGGFRQIGGARGTRCEQNCAAGEDADNAALKCYIPCKSGMNLEGGRGGVCRRPCDAGYTLGASDVCFKDCVAPEADAGGNRCYVACKAGEDASRFPRCHKPCETTAGAGAAYRLIEDRCFPRDPYTYLPIAWMGPIISQADTVENIGLCLPLGQKNGDRAGIWGSVPTTSSDTSWDVVWAYTEDMELVNMNNRKCLDTAFLQSTPTVWDCHGGQQQKWFVDSEGRIRSKQYPDRCLTTDSASGYVEGNPLRLNKSRAIDLQPCTNDGSKFQRWLIPAARVGINQAVAPAAGPPALPAEPLIRDAFTDGSGNDSKPLAARLAERASEDAF